MNNTRQHETQVLVSSVTDKIDKIWHDGYMLRCRVNGLGGARKSNSQIYVLVEIDGGFSVHDP